MRSVVVVLPASMCAMMPIFLIFFSSCDRGISSPLILSSDYRSAARAFCVTLKHGAHMGREYRKNGRAVSADNEERIVTDYAVGVKGWTPTWFRRPPRSRRDPAQAE